MIQLFTKDAQLPTEDDSRVSTQDGSYLLKIIYLLKMTELSTEDDTVVYLLKIP